MSIDEQLNSATNLERLAEAMSAATGMQIKIPVEDKLRAAILEASFFIRSGAPSRALAILETALTYH